MIKLVPRARVRCFWRSDPGNATMTHRSGPSQKVEREGELAHSTHTTAMQAIVAKTVRTQAATAVVAGRPSRSAAVAAGKLASAALNSSNANANGHSSQSPEPGTARRSRSPSSSLSPVPATPPPAGEALVDPEPSTVPVKRSASPAGTGSEDAKPVKKKRTRKPKEPEVYVISDVERKETTFK